MNNGIRRKAKTTLTVLALLFTSVQAAAPTVEDKSLGLSKTGVNESPNPEKFHYSNDFPGSSQPLPRAYLNAPPQIPHNIESFLPVTKKQPNY